MEETSKPKIIKRPVVRWGIFVVVVAVIGFLLGIWMANRSARLPEVPAEIASQVDFPIYLPKNLPDRYFINEKTFSMDEEVLIFQASDGLGGTITFAEQRRLPDFDFNGFYQQRMQDATPVGNTPFQAYAGKNKAGDTEMLSIVTDETWILITTRLPLGESLKDVARHIKAIE